MAALISAFAFTSVCVSARLLSAGQKVCEKWGRGVIIFFTPQSGMCLLLAAFFFQIKSFCNYWSGEAVGAAGRVKDSVIRH